MRINYFLFSAVLSLSLLLAACGGGTPENPTSPPETQISAEETESSSPEPLITGTFLLDGGEIPVCLDVSDTEVTIRSQPSGDLLAAAGYPQELVGAAEALESWDASSDLDGDGNSDLTAEFAFSNGSTASLLWFYTDGGFTYNEKFSRLPEEPDAAGNHTEAQT